MVTRVHDQDVEFSIDTVCVRFGGLRKAIACLKFEGLVATAVFTQADARRRCMRPNRFSSFSRPWLQSEDHEHNTFF